MSFRYATDSFESVPSSESRRLLRKCDWLWANRHLLTHTALRHDLNPLLKWAVGSYRIIYTYDEDADDMVVHLVAHRRDVYKQASNIEV